MADNQKTQATTAADASLDTLAQLQQAGFGAMTGMNTAWIEALSDMGAEVISFVSDRIQEDVKTQHEILRCKNVADLQHIQAQFIQKAMDQYHDETGKLVAMATAAFTKPTDSSES